MISPDELELVDKVFNGFHIPSKPQVLLTLEEILKQEEPDINEVAEVIAKDVGLASVVLKTINSPYYGMRREICEIKQAVMLLGIDVIKALVVGVVLRKSYTKPSCISLERFWDTATDLANTMVFIGQKFKDKISLDKLYTTGLFENCAIPALAIKYDNYRKVLEYCNTHLEHSPVEVESKVYPTNHAIMGYYIATSWGLPSDICNVILNHHECRFLDEVKDEQSRLMFAILKAADNILNRVRSFNQTADWLKVGNACMEILNLSPEDIDDFEDDVSEMLKAH